MWTIKSVGNVLFYFLDLTVISMNGYPNTIWQIPRKNLRHTKLSMDYNVEGSLVSQVLLLDPARCCAMHGLLPSPRELCGF